MKPSQPQQQPQPAPRTDTFEGAKAWAEQHNANKQQPTPPNFYDIDYQVAQTGSQS